MNRLAVGSLLSNVLGVPIGTTLALALGYRALRQVRESNGALRGRAVALAGVIWGWTALAAVALVLVVLAIVAANTIHTDDVQQQVANLALAEKNYKQAHGAYTGNLPDLAVSVDSRIRVHVLADENRFCVDAVYEPHGLTGHTYQDNFTPDGRVTVLDGMCDGLILPPELWSRTLKSFVGTWVSPPFKYELVVSADRTFYLSYSGRQSSQTWGRVRLTGDRLVLIPVEGDFVVAAAVHDDIAAAVLGGTRGLELATGDCSIDDWSCTVPLVRTVSPAPSVPQPPSSTPTIAIVGTVRDPFSDGGISKDCYVTNRMPVVVRDANGTILGKTQTSDVTTFGCSVSFAIELPEATVYQVRIGAPQSISWFTSTTTYTLAELQQANFRIELYVGGE